MKHFFEVSTGTFENQELSDPGSAEILDTFLQRLFLKKIQIPKFSGHGGGLSASGSLLYIITNKGSVQVFDLNKFTFLENNISDVPMNFSELIRSGHPYKNDFRILWFRVNGVYAEYINSENHVLFVSHNAYNRESDCITHNISRTELILDKLSIAQKSNWETIFAASPCISPEPESLLSVTSYPGHVSGGAIVNFDNQNLLVTVGDYDRHGLNGTDEYALDTSNPYGKVILVDKYNGDWSVFTTGHRNATGLYIDRNSVIWSVENGPDGGDELNILAKGDSYGWPKVSLGLWYDPDYNLTGGQKAGTHPGYRMPVFSWIPSIAPSSLTKIEGDKFEYWAGDLLIGTMHDQSLHRLRLDQEYRVVYDERIHLGHRIRDLITLPDGKLAMATDDGYLIIVEDGGPSFHDMNSDAKEKLALLDSYVLPVEVDKAGTPVYERSPKVIFQRNCAGCHSLNGRNQIGPHLQKLMNRKIGGIDNYNYSQTLTSETRSWNTRLLKSFLEDPEDEFPGSRMQRINLYPAEIDSLILFFQNQENDK